MKLTNNSLPQHVLTFKQAWLEENSADFRPAKAELYPNKTGLQIVLTFEDEEIYNDATGFNQYALKLGDVAEIFVAVPGEPAYWELHITPNNHRLQLAWDKQRFESAKKGILTLEDCMVADPEFIQSAVTVDTAENRWQTTVFLPWKSIDLPDGQEIYTLELAFCRYDASRSQEKATLSSTAPLSKADYHRRHEWDVIQLEVPARTQ